MKINVTWSPLTKTHTVQRNKVDGAQASTQLRHHNAWRCCGLLLATLLLGCASEAPTTKAPAASTGKSASIKQLLDTAHSSALEARAPYLLDAAALSLTQNNPDQTATILQELNSLKLTSNERVRNKVLLARLQLKRGQPAQALTTLQDKQLTQDLALLSSRAQIDVSLLRAQAQTETHNYFASAQELVFIDPLLSGQEREQNHKNIQRALSAISATELEQLRSKPNNEQMRGWLDLAIAARNATPQQSDRSRPASAPPATPPLPNDTPQARTNFTAAAQLPQPKQIALLLPLSGKLAAFGSALRDGFMAAWYDSQQHGGNPPLVKFYDTEGNANIAQLYQQALSDGANAVVGPLEKQHVAQLHQQPLAVPTLALNRTDSGSQATPNLYQFGLAAEDETAQIADIAALEKHRSALIIVPEDETRSRELQLFEQRWQQQGGTVSAVAEYRDQQNMSQAIRTALNIPRSEARAKELESIINRNIEFTPHRRQDIDMVFILAKPAQARVIKPLLDFYYAGDLTVYSTSRIYSGYPIPSLDRDLDKIRFTEMPFILQTSLLKQEIINAQPQSKNYLRLYAMGIDSFNLIPRLIARDSLSSNPMYGQTGQLTMTSENIIQRTSLLAVLRGGNLEAATTLAHDAHADTVQTSTAPPDAALPSTPESGE